MSEEAHEFADLPGHECDDGFHHLGPQTGYSRLWHLLDAALKRRDIVVEYDTAARDLVRDESGAVTGVIAEAGDARTAFHARRGTILATGGFENNQEMVRNYLGLPCAFPWGSPSNTGDGIRMAQRVGADLVHMHNFAGVMGVCVPESGRGMAGVPKAPGFILVGRDGRRFVNESINDRHGKVRRRGAYEQFPAETMYTVFDERTRLAGPIVVPFEQHGSGWPKTIDGYEWSQTNQSEVDRGWIVAAPSLRELGDRLGIDGEGLETTVSRYNDFCEAGHDPQFERPAADLEALREGPYYGFRSGPVMMYTCGGPRKDAAARVLDTEGGPIGGLYCAGEVSSTYPWAMSGGQMVSDALAFGRIAGRSVAGIDGDGERR
jgi:succinate dehydrogenase/fumarate reductase flavoprotein subunit